MNFPASAQPMVNAPMVMPNAPIVNTGRPDVRTGAPTQLGCGAVGIGCGPNAQPLADSMHFGADTGLTATGWPWWAKMLTSVAVLGLVGWGVHAATR